MKEEKGSGITWPMVLLAVVAWMFLKDSMGAVTNGANASAVNSLGQNVGALTQTVDGLNTNQADIMGQLNSLVTGMNTMSEVQTRLGGILEQVVGGLNGLVNEVGGIKQQLQLTDGRVLNLEQRVEELRINGGTVNNGLPTPAPLVTQ